MLADTSNTYDYNIPSNNRELQRYLVNPFVLVYYNIPSNNRELQLPENIRTSQFDYNIPSNNRELQLRLMILF